MEQEVRRSATKYFPSIGDFQLLTLLERALDQYIAMFESDWLKSNEDVVMLGECQGPNLYPIPYKRNYKVL